MPRAKVRPQPRDRGQIIPKGDQKWLLRVYKGKDGAGKRQYTSKAVAGTFSQAEKALTKLLSEVDEGTHVEPSKRQLGEYLTAWLETRRDLAKKTFRDYQDRIRLDVTPYLGATRLDQLTKDRINGLVTTLVEERALSPRTVQYTMVILKAALQDAVEDGLLSRNPALKVVLPKVVKRQATILTADQMATFLEASTNSTMHALWTVLLTTGMRPQEALALQWAHLTGTSMMVVQALNEVERGKREVGEVKADRSRRTVVLPEGTLEVLKAHRKRQVAEILKAGPSYRDQGYIFAGSGGYPLDLSAVRRRWKGDLKAAKLPEVRLYDSRHSHQTALLMAGEAPQVVADRGGHSVETLMEYYAHVLPTAQAAAAGKVESLLFRRTAI